MSEDIQKQILLILQSIHQNTPEVFNNLIQQRTQYCYTIFMGYVFSVIILFISGLIFITRQRYEPFVIGINNDPTARFFFVFGGGVCILASIILTSQGLPYLAEYQAPLGRVLEIIR